jgi:hypothetical protein
LDKYYDGNEKVNRMKLQSLRRKYELMSREEDQRVNDYFSKLLAMRSLTSKFDFVVVAI